MDTSGDGEIDFEEFHAWYTSEGEFRRKAKLEATQAETRRLRQIFDCVDADGGGSIDAEEVAQLARKLFGADLTPLELKRAMKEMDPDRSGGVTFEEFERWFSGEGDFRKRAEKQQRLVAKEQAQRVAMAQEEQARRGKLEWLRAIFRQVDDDDSGAIDKYILCVLSACSCTISVWIG